MKKLFVLLLSVVLMLGLVACGGNNLDEELVGRCIYLPTFSLSTNSAIYADYEIDARKIERIISGRHDNEWDWMVLLPDEPIQYSTFMQVGSPLGGSGYSIEIGFGDGIDGFRLYRLYANRSVAIQYMLAYWQKGIIPDISSWEDISGGLTPMESAGFNSPESVVIAFLEGLRDSDLTRMIGVVPDEDFYDEDICIEEEMRGFIDHFNFLIEEFQIPITPFDFQSLEVLGFIPPEALDERYSDERHQINMVNKAERIEVAQLVHRVAIFELGGEKHMIVVDVVDFGGDWRISSFGGVFGNMINIPIYLHGIVPSELLCDFLGEFELETLMIPAY